MAIGFSTRQGFRARATDRYITQCDYVGVSKYTATNPGSEIRTSADAWTEGGSFWEVGLPETSDREGIRQARAALDEGKAEQRVGW